MSSDPSGNITINRTGGTAFRFDTTGLINPSTLLAVADLGAVVWSIKVDKEFTLVLETEPGAPAIRWFRFTAEHAAQLGKATREFELRADFGSGPQRMANGQISAVGLIA